MRYEYSTIHPYTGELSRFCAVYKNVIGNFIVTSRYFNLTTKAIKEWDNKYVT